MRCQSNDGSEIRGESVYGKEGVWGGGLFQRSAQEFDSKEDVREKCIRMSFQRGKVQRWRVNLLYGMDLAAADFAQFAFCLGNCSGFVGDGLRLSSAELGFADVFLVADAEEEVVPTVPLLNKTADGGVV
jgi:hypothetical protein